MSDCDEDRTPNISDVDCDDDEDDEAVSAASASQQSDDPGHSEPQAVIPELYKRFLEEQQKAENDPPETPYKSKYAARRVLRELHGILATELDLGYGEDKGTEEAAVVSSEAEATTTGSTTEQDRCEQPAAATEAHATADAATAPASNGDSPKQAGRGPVDLKMPRNILNILLGHVHLQLGVSFCETEQNSEGERNLRKSHDFLAPYRNSSECVIAFVSVCNQLGYLLSNRSQHQSALPYLKEAEEAYHHYTGNGEGVTRPPCGVHQMFSPSLKPDSPHLELTKGHTHTLYFLAQVYKQLGETELAAHYCMATLKRQLSSGSHDPHDWALNCGTLSCFFLSQGRYSDALYCLASAMCMLKKPAANGDAGAELSDVEKEARDRKNVTVSRLWVTYATNLLEDSQKEVERKELMSDEEKTEAAEVKAAEADESGPSKPKESNDAEEEEEEGDSQDDDVGAVKFPLEGTEGYTKGVPTALVSDFESARQLFLLGQRHVELAKKFFTLDDHCTDHVELIQNHSMLYKRLAFFDKDQDRICKMHRRRADMLAEAAKELNPQYYLYVVRQLRFEAAEAFVSLLDLKLDSYGRAMEAGQAPDMKLVKRINMLVLQAKQQFDAFTTSLRDPQGNMPEMYAEDVARPALLCKFHIARLYTKIIVNDSKARIYNLRQSLVLHTEIIEQCDSNPAVAKLFEVELEISRDIVMLLPRQLDKLAAAS